MPDTTTTSSTPVLERRLGPFDAAAIIIANVIGGGILFRSPAVAAALPDATWFLLAWVGGGVLAFMGAMAYAELAALRPKAGGEYVYLREAFGPLAGFLTGWTSFVAGFSGAMAASAVFLIVTLDRFIPGVANGTPLLAIPIPFTSSGGDLLHSHAGGERRHHRRRAHSHPRRRSRPHRQQRADDAQDRGAGRLHRFRADGRNRVAVEPHTVRWGRSP